MVSPVEVSIATFSSETEAMMLREALENEGIPTVLVPLASGAGGLGATVWRPFELRVRSGDVDRARELLEMLRDDA